MKILSTRKRVATAAIGLGVVIGSAGVASALSGSPASPVNPNTVATPTTDGADTPPAGDATIGADNSNKDPAHEAAESPDVAAAEAAGRGHAHGGGDGDGPGGADHRSNTDPAHEAAESTERAAQEATNDAALPATTVAGG